MELATPLADDVATSAITTTTATTTRRNGTAMEPATPPQARRFHDRNDYNGHHRTCATIPLPPAARCHNEQLPAPNCHECSHPALTLLRARPLFAPAFAPALTLTHHSMSVCSPAHRLPSPTTLTAARVCTQIIMSARTRVLARSVALAHHPHLRTSA